MALMFNYISHLRLTIKQSLAGDFGFYWMLLIAFLTASVYFSKELDFKLALFLTEVGLSILYIFIFKKLTLKDKYLDKLKRSKESIKNSAIEKFDHILNKKIIELPNIEFTKYLFSIFIITYYKCFKFKVFIKAKINLPNICLTPLYFKPPTMMRQCASGYRSHPDD